MRRWGQPWKNSKNRAPIHGSPGHWKSEDQKLLLESPARILVLGNSRMKEEALYQAGPDPHPEAFLAGAHDRNVPCAAPEAER
jgi:hypothetical protein